MEHIFLALSILACLGVLTGFIAGLLGVGGGTVLVPALVTFGHYFYAGQIGDDILMHTALATSMAVIIATGMSSARSQIKRQMVDWMAIKRLIPGLLVGVVIGIVAAAHLDGAALQIIFGVGMLGMAALIAKQPAPNHINPKLLDWNYALPITTGVGVLATLLGVGGSILNIPYMTYGGLPLHRAIATGSVLGVLVALPAAIGFVISGLYVTSLPPEFLGYINMKAWICIVPFSMLTAPLGVRASHKINPRKLRMVFACFILIVALKMLWNVI